MGNKLSEFGLEDEIAQTLFIPLYMKSQESQRPNAFFNDPIACDIIENCHFDLSFFKKCVKSSVGCAIRSGYFDMMAADFATKNDDVVVVNIGCGLDTRYERVNHLVTVDAQFYHLDLPEVIELREKLIPSCSQDKSIKASLFDTGWMDSLKSRHRSASFMFIFEGVLMYFDNEQVREVLTSLAKRFPGSYILFDATSCWARDNSHRHDSLKYTNARFKLGLDNPEEIEKWHGNLSLLSTRYYCDFPEWKSAGYFNYYMMKLVPVFRRASYLVYCSIK